MSALVPVLDDLNFAALVERGRALIPGLAPGWTDHNLHDPGITLLELLAWVADQQIYSAGRVGREERRAFAALLGVAPRGAAPARGLVWPDPETADVGRPLDAGTRLAPEGVDAPPFALHRPVYLAAARISGIACLPAGEEEVDVPDSAGRRLGFAPFGGSARPGSRLRLRLDGALVRPVDAQGPIALTLGVEAEPFPDEPAADEAAAPAVGRGPRLHAELRPAEGSALWKVAIVRDETAGLARTGTLRLRLSRGVADAAARYDTLQLDLILAGGEHTITPRVTRVSLNVLEVVQLESVASEILGAGSGQPDQEFRLEQPPVVTGTSRWDGDLWAFADGQMRRWRLVADLGASGPGDLHARLDPDGRGVRFGNGINGRLPPEGASIEARYRTTAGALGNLPAGLRWRLLGRGVGRGVPFGRNRAPIAGGCDAEDQDSVRSRARRAVARAEAIVTDQDLIERARAVPSGRVARAETVTCGAPGERTLVVLRRRRASELDLPALDAEPPAYLAALARELAPARLLGESLRVVGPQMVRVGVRGRLLVAGRSDPEAVRRAALVLLERRLAPLPRCPGDEPWPFGRAVRALELAGWLRRLEGVRAVLMLEVNYEGGPFGVEARLPRRGLPRLDPPHLEITTASGAGERVS